MSLANLNSGGEFILEAEVMNATEKVRCQGNYAFHSFFFFSNSISRGAKHSWLRVKNLNSLKFLRMVPLSL